MMHDLRQYQFVIIFCFVFQRILVSGATAGIIDPVAGSSHNSCNASSALSNDNECIINDQEQKQEDNDDQEEVIECGIWLAPSSIPGSGLGMYAGNDYGLGETIQRDSVIPIVDIEYYHDDTRKRFLWFSYTWTFQNIMAVEGVRETQGASPGFGSVANSFLDLLNVDEMSPVYSIPEGMHRYNDPGVGSFSPYHSRPFVASKKINTGQELFVSYGENWFKVRTHLGPVPLFDDLGKGTKLFHQFFNLKMNISSSLSMSTNTSTMWDDLWETFVISSSWNTTSRVIGAFTNTKEELEKLETLSSSLYDIRVQESTRTVKWLQTNGNCADNMVGKSPSTIRHAGNGAFATRRLRKNTVVSPLPLIHVERQLFDMYKITNKQADKTAVVGKQLLLNYCYGNSKSSVILCPYSPITNLINHNQTRSNVKLQWADPNRGNHHPEYLDKNPKELFDTTKSVLAMELVATRVIEKNEEVLLDYGNEWEQSWSRHVQNWEPPVETKYTAAQDMNRLKENGKIRLRTEFEKLEYPYPTNLVLKCRINFFHCIDLGSWNETRDIHYKDNKQDEWENCEILRYERDTITDTTATSDSNDEVLNERKDLSYTTTTTIGNTEKEFKHLLYTASTIGTPGKGSLIELKKIINAPQEAFKFFDVPHSSDLYLKNVFRHEIMIPDDIFPPNWLD